MKQDYYHTIMDSFKGGRSLEINRRSGASFFDALRQRLVRDWGAYDSAWWWLPLLYNCMHAQQKLDWKKHNSVWVAAYTICCFWESEFESNESCDRSLILEVAPSHLKLDFLFFLFFLINFFGVQLLYEVVLVSAVQLSDSAVCLPYIPSFLDFRPI